MTLSQIQRSTKITAVAGALLALLAAAAPAGLLVQYDFEQTNTVASTIGAHITAADFGYVGGGTTNFNVLGCNSAVGFKSTIWSSDTTPGSYFVFSVTVEAGFIVELTDLSFAEIRSGDGPTDWLVQYSSDGTTFHSLGAGISQESWHERTAAATRPVDLTGTVYFRLYGLSASSGSGTWRVDNVTLNGSLRVDDGIRVIRYQSFDGGGVDTWPFVTNQATAAVSTDRAYAGAKSLRLTGPAVAGTHPQIELENVDLTGMSNVALSMAYAADGPDSLDDLFLDLSHDGGVFWQDVGSVTLVQGYSQCDVAFGETSATEPTTVADNPHLVSIGSDKSEIMVRVTFNAFGTGSADNDHYYVDDIRLTAVPTPGQGAPVVSNYGGVDGLASSKATVRGHVITGYPYPDVTVYWGLFDGGTDASAWSHATALDTSGWGVFATNLTGLAPGCVYYYRCYAANAHGEDWADSTTNFTTTAVAVDALRRAYVDTLGIGKDMPLCIDRDGNGLADRWERDNLGGAGSDPNGDPDNDGWSNYREYLAGTDPNDETSYMRIVGLDLEDPTSDNIVLTWAGGDFGGSSSYVPAGDAVGRRFRIMAADNDGGADKAATTIVTNDGAAVHSWTDTDAVSRYTSRFYSVGVALGGGSCSNVEEWAVHVQPREAGARYLVCVPVNYGTTASNSLSGPLGEQLARGLYAGFTTGDVVRVWNAQKAWVTYMVTTNAGGELQWTTNGVAAELAVTPGLPMWIYRGSGAAPRGNAVFTGRSFTEATVAGQSVTTNAGSWNMFGWPMSYALSHSATSSETNQLGFAASGTGGIPGTDDPSDAGDQLWAQQGNGWRFYELLDNHAAGGEGYDGRWWGNGVGGGGLATFSLEPGKAYYYYHPRHWNATNFTWRPPVAP